MKNPMTLCQVRHIATSALPVDCQNDDTVQDAFARLREDLKTVDSTGLCYETEEAPDYLVKRVYNLNSWINHSRQRTAAR